MEIVLSECFLFLQWYDMDLQHLQTGQKSPAKIALPEKVQWAEFL